MRFTLSLLLLLALALPVRAQQSPSASLDPALTHALGSPTLSKSAAPLHLIVRGEPGAIRSAVEAAGGTVESVIGDIVTIRLPSSAVAEVGAAPGIAQMQLGARYKTRNDSARVTVGAQSVHAGLAPLAQAYTGEGVIVGIIDSGIDFRHRDFRDPADSSKSRVAALWDQNAAQGTPPVGYSYGNLVTREQLEADLGGTAPVFHFDTDGHGTHVAGSAAGNGSAVGRHGGMAPDAQLLVVAVNFEPETQQAFAASLIDAAAWIFATAERMEMPAVINASLGAHEGPHDGSSLDAIALDALVEGEHPYARAFVAAGGNEGSELIHWSADLTSDASWTWRASNEARYYLTIDGGTLSDVSLSVSADAPTSFSTFEAGTPIPIDLAALAASGQTREIIFEDADEDEVAYLEIAVGVTPSMGYDVLIIWEDDGVQNDDGSFEDLDLLRLSLTGDGSTVHAWSEESTSPEQLGLTVDPGAGYTLWDNEYTVGLPAVARTVIAVGAANNIGTDAYARGDRAEFSSIGPTTDGRIKPEIVAPGQDVASSLSFDARGAYAGQELEGGQHVYQSGTSMSSPITAGAVALYMQANPTASIAQIRDALFQTTAKDLFTGTSLPNNEWGYGKLDIFAALSTQITPTDDLVETGTTRLATSAPHPIRTTGRIAYEVGQPGDATLALYDALGRRVAVLLDGPLAAGTHTADLDASSLPSGLYLLRLTTRSGASTQAVTVVR